MQTLNQFIADVKAGTAVMLAGESVDGKLVTHTAPLPDDVDSVTREAISRELITDFADFGEARAAIEKALSE